MLPSSGHVISCATDGHIKCWDYTTEKMVHEIKIEEEFLCIAYRRSSHQIVAGTESAKVVHHSSVYHSSVESVSGLR